MINIDTNLGFILVCAIVICSYCVISKVFFYYSDAKSFTAFLNLETNDVIRCGNGNTKWVFFKYLTVIIILIITFLLLWKSYSVELFVVFVVIYFLVIFIHLLSYKKFVEYYVSEDGVWINKVDGPPAAWSDITIEKEWVSSSRKFQRINVNGKNHIIVYPRTLEQQDIDDDESDEIKKDLIRNKYMSSSLKNIQKNILAESVLILVAVIIIVVCGLYTARSTGHVLSEYNNSIDFTVVCSEEQAVYAKPETIYKAENGYFYASKEEYACVNVYNANGEFLYAYHPPMKFGRGDSEFAIDGDTVYIKNRADIIYIYNGQNYVGTVEADAYHEIEYVEEQLTEEHSKMLYGDKLYIGYEGIIAVMIGVFMYLMAMGNLGELWEYLLLCLEDKQNAKNKTM